ncbi:zinc finger protein JAGGED-like, partial [Rutidosis leptorrhynchoides]|uniref:zinc finger protein JAGGED-like n=1 Tax=Rutidosis leptorrhynchoides TaxID=125765 RepID=UPI003A9914F0
RPENNPLDLNNFPEDYSRDNGKQQVFEDGSSSGCRKKKSGAKDGKDECGKVYECRFCSLKFCKSQALGGHMNRHRQERETETLNRARQLVYNTDNLPPQAHIGCHPMAPAGGYHSSASIMGDPALPYRSTYPPPPAPPQPRLFSGSSTSTLLQPPPPPPPPPSQQQQQAPPYLYPSPPSSRLPSSYPPHHNSPINDYYVGHVLSGSNSTTTQFPHTHHHHHNLNNFMNAHESTSYTCIGAPVGHTFTPGGSGSGSGAGANNQEEGLTWGRSSYTNPSSINRSYQDGF